MDWNPLHPYNELPLLPPSIDVESKEVLKLCIEARLALEHLKMVIETSPFKDAIISNLPILESKFNCEIDDIIVNINDLFRFKEKEKENPLELDPIIKCKHALIKGGVRAQRYPLNHLVAKVICSTVNGSKEEIRSGSCPLTKASSLFPLYTPPLGGEIVKEKLLNWEEFLNSESDLDPLISVALAHYQFDAIKPFMKGNGRTGRILSQVVLVNKEILNGPYLCLSQYLNENRMEYYSRLSKVTQEGDWNAWLMFMLEALRASAIWTAQKADGIQSYLVNLSKEMEKDRQLRKIKSDSLLELLGHSPYLKIADLIDSGLVKRKTASKYLNLLASKGILEKEITLKGNVFIHRSYLELLSST